MVEGRRFMVKAVAKFAKRHGIADAELSTQLDRVEAGTAYAALGGDLFKVRFGAYRAWASWVPSQNAYVVAALDKADGEDLKEKELRRVRRTAEILHSLDADAIEAILQAGEITEIARPEKPD